MWTAIAQVLVPWTHGGVAVNLDLHNESVNNLFISYICVWHDLFISLLGKINWSHSHYSLENRNFSFGSVIIKLVQEDRVVVITVTKPRSVL